MLVWWEQTSSVSDFNTRIQIWRLQYDFTSTDNDILLGYYDIYIYI